MSELNNYEMMNATFQILLKIISKRTSINVAHDTLSQIVNHLETKYEFLKYVKIENNVYFEMKNNITINQEINNEDSTEVITCLKEIVNYSTSAIGEQADYFFIREVRDNLSFNNEIDLKDFLLSLGGKQNEYLINRKIELNRNNDSYQIKNSEVIGPVLKALIYLLDKILEENKALEKINIILQEKQKKYYFFNYVSIGKNDNENFIDILDKEVNSVIPIEFAEAMEELIISVGRFTEWEMYFSYIDKFKEILGPEMLLKLQIKGLDLEKINISLRYQNRTILQNVLNALFDIISIKTSKEEAIQILKTELIRLMDTYSVFKYITINSSEQKTFYKTFDVDPDINSLDSYHLGTPLRRLIRDIQNDFNDRKIIEWFKIKLGEEYLEEIEKIGVNLHFIELMYS